MVAKKVPSDLQHYDFGECIKRKVVECGRYVFYGGALLVHF